MFMNRCYTKGAGGSEERGSNVPYIKQGFINPTLPRVALPSPGRFIHTKFSGNKGMPLGHIADLGGAVTPQRDVPAAVGNNLVLVVSCPQGIVEIVTSRSDLSLLVIRKSYCVTETFLITTRVPRGTQEVVGESNHVCPSLPNSLEYQPNSQESAPRLGGSTEDSAGSASRGPHHYQRALLPSVK